MSDKRLLSKSDIILCVYGSIIGIRNGVNEIIEEVQSKSDLKWEQRAQLATVKEMVNKDLLRDIYEGLSELFEEKEK